jgi:ATP-dependent Clp protease ATP-binding subunit ClpA
MKVARYIICVALTLSFAALGDSFEPVTLVVGGILGIGSSLFAVGLWKNLHCHLIPCCDSTWLIHNFTGLEHDLRTKLHGQSLASGMVAQLVKTHLKSDYPTKALVLSFHGPTGVGKTFVSNLIAENMFRDGQHSPFVHLISAMRDFPHQRMVPLYQMQLLMWLQGNVTKCDRSVFIFEEIDKLPAGFLDILVPVLHDKTEGINYRKAIFIFLSNTGSSDIVKVTFDHWKSGESRETLQSSEFQTAIMKAISEDEDYGLWQSKLVSNNLISAFIPFLPLEKVHVTKCIADALVVDRSLATFRLSQKLVDDVIKQMTFSPFEEPVFSDMGCKRVAQKIYDAIG